MTDSSPTASIAAAVATDLSGRTCLGRTCLQWSADGELTSVDLLFVLERLAQVDQELTGLQLACLDGQPCPTIN